MINLKNRADVVLRRISKEDFLNINRINIKDVERIVRNELFEGMERKDADTIDSAMLLGFLYNAFPDNVNDVWCELIIANWHYMHEDIAMLLKDIKSPDTVDCSYKATELQFNYLDYDDTYQFARKCIKAISEIGDKNAISKLWLLSESKNAIIAEYAKKELRYKELL